MVLFGMKIFLLKNSHQLEGILRAKYLSGWIIKDSKQEPHKEFLSQTVFCPGTMQVPKI